MKIYKAKVFQDVDNIICDLCGESCSSSGGIEHAEFYAIWGYFSDLDGEKWDCDLCEKCAKKIKEYIEAQGGIVRTKDSYPV